MPKMKTDRFPVATNFLKSLAWLFLSAIAVSAQAGPPEAKIDPSSSARAEKIIERAIEAVGGTRYLNVSSVVGRGFYTPYQEGVSQVPMRFLDYIVYPDRERTEFTSSGIRTIQTNFGDAGWIYDGATKTLSDMKPTQIEDFKRAMRTSVENLLRGWWRKEGASISYAGRREAGLAKRNETVRLTYSDGFWIEYEFGAQDGLPAKIIYPRGRKNSDTDETEEVKEEDRIARLITIDGIAAPLVIDRFKDGVQASRINYESVEYNRPLPDTLFEKPENVKSLK
jgi:hypothetical protein